MTFSILARDPESNAIGGAAATGSLCVGGWVLRGDARAGMSASQGAAPSTMWGEDVLLEMAKGLSTADAVDRITKADTRREYRQLSALGLTGAGAVFTGTANTPVMDGRIFDGGVAAGNLLSSTRVLESLVDDFQSSSGTFAVRLLSALKAGQNAGGDSRGLLSAALLIVSPDHAPLTLRIDYNEDPLAALEALYNRATSGDYYTWSQQVPTLNDPERILD